MSRATPRKRITIEYCKKYELSNGNKLSVENLDTRVRFVVYDSKSDIPKIFDIVECNKDSAVKLCDQRFNLLIRLPKMKIEEKLQECIEKYGENSKATEFARTKYEEAIINDMDAEVPEYTDIIINIPTDVFLCVQHLRTNIERTDTSWEDIMELILAASLVLEKEDQHSKYVSAMYSGCIQMDQEFRAAIAKEADIKKSAQETEHESE